MQANIAESWILAGAYLTSLTIDTPLAFYCLNSWIYHYRMTEQFLFLKSDRAGWVVLFRWSYVYMVCILSYLQLDTQRFVLCLLLLEWRGCNTMLPVLCDTQNIWLCSSYILVLHHSVNLCVHFISCLDLALFRDLCKVANHEWNKLYIYIYIYLCVCVLLWNFTLKRLWMFLYHILHINMHQYTCKEFYVANDFLVFAYRCNLFRSWL